MCVRLRMVKHSFCSRRVSRIDGRFSLSREEFRGTDLGPVLSPNLILGTKCEERTRGTKRHENGMKNVPLSCSFRHEKCFELLGTTKKFLEIEECDVARLN